MNKIDITNKENLDGKYPHRTYLIVPDLEPLYDKGLIQDPVPQVKFVKQEFDNRQWWLEITNGLSTYQTSINKKMWFKLDDIAKAGIINVAKYKLGAYEE